MTSTESTAKEAATKAEKQDDLGKLAAATLASVRRWVRSTSGPQRGTLGNSAPDQPQYSGARPDGRDPRLVSADLDRFIKGRGWDRQTAAATVIARWSDIAGETLANHVSAETFDGASATLFLRADSAMWATQVKLLVTDLMGKIDEAIGSGIVDNIEVLGPISRKPSFGLRSVKFNRQ